MRLKLAIGALCVLLLLSSLVTAWAVYGRFSATNERRAAQHAFNVRLTQIDTRDCQEIEKLKKAQRDIAIDNFKKLPANAKLLGIPLTHELVVAARDAKFSTLKRYAPEACPRQLKQEAKS